ncbi:hypothetical protein ACTHGU_12010 [Chitinophagaceae bacterium MMS25-I14]
MKTGQVCFSYKPLSLITHKITTMLITMQGTWTIKVKARYAAFPQRFIVSGAASGNGTYLANEKLSPVTVTGRQWTIAVQNDPGPGFQLSDTRIKFPVKNGSYYEFDIESNDAGADKDFDDLILTCSSYATINDFIIYGNTTLYKGRCIFNPCHRNILVIDKYASLVEALKNDYLKKIIEQLYPERIPPVNPNPPDPAPYFKPLIINLQDEVAPTQVQMQYRAAVSSKRSADAASEANNALGMDQFELVRTTQTNVNARLSSQATFDKVSLASQIDKLRFVCSTTPAANVTLSFEEYDRTLAEKLGGVYTGTGNRQLLGDTITDMNGNYIFRFTFNSFSQLIEGLTDIAAGENYTTVKLPDIIVKVKEAQAPFKVLYESIPYYNIPNLKRIDLCIPQSSVPPVFQCFNGSIISGLGNVFIGGDQNSSGLLQPTILHPADPLDRNGFNNHLHPDGRISVHNSQAGFAVDCASWNGLIDIKGCLYNIQRKAGDPIIAYYTLRIMREGAADWSFVNQPYVQPQYSKRSAPGYSGDPVGPFNHTIHIDGATYTNAPTYKNTQKEIFIDGIDWEYTDRYMQLNTGLYDMENGAHDPGTFYLRVDGFDSAGNHVSGATDLIALFINNKPLNFGLTEASFIDPVEKVNSGNCTLYRLYPDQMQAAVNFKFKAGDTDGFVDSYQMSISKCPNSIAMDIDAPPVSVATNITNGILAAGTASGNTDASGCTGYTGTTEDFSVPDYVTMQIHPTSSWMLPEEQYVTIYFGLTAYVRTTNGYNSGVTGPYQASTGFAIERKS